MCEQHPQPTVRKLGHRSRTGTVVQIASPVRPGKLGIDDLARLPRLSIVVGDDANGAPTTRTFKRDMRNGCYDATRAQLNDTASVPRKSSQDELRPLPSIAVVETALDVQRHSCVFRLRAGERPSTY